MSEAIIARRQGGKRITPQIITPSTSNQTITRGLHDGTGYVEGDADLVAGNILAGKTIFDVAGTGGLGAGDRLHFSSDVAKDGQQIVMTKTKDILINTAGIYRVKFYVRSNDDVHTAYGQIYKNDVAYGTMRENTTTSNTVYTEDLYFDAGDNVQIYAKQIDAGYYYVVGDFRLYDNLVIATLILA